MKNVFVIICLLFISLTLVLWGCGDDEPSNPSSDAEYYVRYEATVSSKYKNGYVKYTVITETGPETFTSGKSFSRTCGPFKKGFHATISANANDLYPADCNLRIYVSHKDEPFVIKANKYGGEMITLSYIIDY